MLQVGDREPNGNRSRGVLLGLFDKLFQYSGIGLRDLQPARAAETAIPERAGELTLRAPAALRGGVPGSLLRFGPEPARISRTLAPRVLLLVSAALARFG